MVSVRSREIRGAIAPFVVTAVVVALVGAAAALSITTSPSTSTSTAPLPNNPAAATALSQVAHATLAARSFTMTISARERAPGIPNHAESDRLIYQAPDRTEVYAYGVRAIFIGSVEYVSIPTALSQTVGQWYELSDQSGA